MTDKQARVGVMVGVKDSERFSGVDLDGKPIPAAARIVRTYATPGYRRQWIVLEGVNGQFRASDLVAR